MGWICPRCQSKSKGNFCFKCGQQRVQVGNVNAPVHTATVPSTDSILDPTIAKLRSSVKTFKIICFILIGIVVLMLGLFAFTYYSVDRLGYTTYNLRYNVENLRENTENLQYNVEDLQHDVEDLQYDAKGLWDNVECLWDDADCLWDELGDVYY